MPPGKKGENRDSTGKRARGGKVSFTSSLFFLLFSPYGHNNNSSNYKNNTGGALNLSK